MGQQREHANQNKRDNIDNPHDKGYKHLLSSKKAFIEMLKSFIKEKWVQDIDETEMMLVNKSYISSDFSEKEADIVYKIKLQEKEIIFYVLLELQSTVDFEIPIRLLFYMTEIWRDTLKNIDNKKRARKEFRLPAIIPMVLYNGAASWTACKTFKEVLNGYEIFGKYMVDFTYFLLDVNRYSKEELHKLSNLMGSVFLLDQKMDTDEFKIRLRKLIKTLAKLDAERLQLFKTWFKKIIKPKLPQKIQTEVEKIIDEANPKEVEQMVYNLEHTLEEMQHEAEQRGIQKVIQNMLGNNIDIETIHKMTGMPIDKVKKIQKGIVQ